MFKILHMTFNLLSRSIKILYPEPIDMFQTEFPYYNQLYANKMDQLEEMDKFIERYNF